MKTKSIQKPSSQQSFNRTRPTASPAAATTRRAVQVTFGSATLKGSNVIAAGKEVRRNPGFEGLSFVPALARDRHSEKKRICQQDETETLLEKF
ncbi:hypothetical protein JYB64_08850 [Algoriphagus aestuarii]|nr:hypothetical protein [Algoriphagus aestuarii]